MSPTQKTQDEASPRIRRASVGSVNLYEITEEELTALEHGSPESLYLLFATFLISTATSFLISLLTTKIELIRVYIIFVVITVVGFTAGIVLFILWFREYRSSNSVSCRIRKRMQEVINNESTRQNADDPLSTLGNRT